MAALSFSAFSFQPLHHCVIASPCPPSSWFYSRRPPLAALSSFPHLLLSPSRFSAAKSDHYIPGSISRRNAAATIVLFLQSLQSAVALGGDACALDDSCMRGLENGNDCSQVETNQILEIARLDGEGPILLPKSVFEGDFKRQRLIPTSKQQFHTASMGWMKSSGSSLGLLGGMLFGFLFLRERQARIANDDLLEDVHTRTRKADTELLSRTRSTLRLKSETFETSNQVREGVLQSEAFLHQVMSTKSNSIKLEEELRVQRNMFQSLKQKENGLKAGLEKLDKDCRFLTEELNRKLESVRMLEAQMQTINLLLRSEEKEISSLKLAVEDQEKVVSEYLQEENVLADSLDKSRTKVHDVEENISRSNKRLCAEMELVESMREELTVATSTNSISDKKLNELYMELQEARQMFLAEMGHLKNLLSLKEREAYAMSSKLTTENGKVEASLHMLEKLRSEKENLNQVSMEKKDILNTMKKQMEATRKELNKYERERATLQDALNKQFAMQRVEGGSDTYGILLQQPGSCGGAEGEDTKLFGEAVCIGKENASTNTLGQEFLEAREALRASDNEILSLQDRVNLYLTQEAQLKEDLAALHEKQQGYAMALRKEKRASAYAKKKIVQCEEVLAGETATMQGLLKDLEQARQHLESLKQQSSIWAYEMETVNTSVLCLEEEVSSLKVNLETERIGRKELGKKVKKVTSISSRPARIKRVSASKSLKSNTKHLHQPPEDNAAADDALGTAAIS